MAVIERSPAVSSGRWRNLALLAAAAALLAVTYWAWGGFRSELRHILEIVGSGNIQELRDYLRSFGVWAPIVSALIMVLQSVLFPLPAFIVTVANGLLFGAFWGTLLSWSSAMLGAGVCYGIARVLGRPTVERLASKKALAAADRFFERYGNRSVLIARLIPVVSFDIVSYMAGATSVSFLGFMVATGIGQLPATILYSILGQNLPKMANLGLYAFGGVAALLVLGLTVKKAFDKRLKRQEAGKAKQ